MLFYIYMYKCGKKTVVSFWDQKVISVCCNNSNLLQQVAALRTYIYLLTTKNTRKKVLDFDALTLVNISQEVILLPGFKVQ